jgi:site-specific recombinase XerD
MVYSIEQVQAAFLAHHEALGRSPKTISHYHDSFALLNRYLAEHEHAADTSSLTSPILQRFAAWLREEPTKGWRGSTKRSPTGVHGVLKDVKAFVRWLAAEELIMHSVTVPVPTLPQMLFPILTDEEIDRGWRSQHLTFPGDLGKRNRALLALMFDTGLRRAEVTGLEVADIDLENQLLRVVGKGNKERRVPFSTGVTLLLQEWLTARGNEPGSVFLLKPAGLRMLFDRIKEDAGLALFHPHQLRHQSATMMVRANADLHAVKRILGHSHISVTERYLSLSDDDLRAKHAVASPFEKIRAQLEPIAVTNQRRRLTRG